jgi:hypothetical protein
VTPDARLEAWRREYDVDFGAATSAWAALGQVVREAVKEERETGAATAERLARNVNVVVKCIARAHETGDWADAFIVFGEAAGDAIRARGGPQ